MRSRSGGMPGTWRLYFGAICLFAIGLYVLFAFDFLGWGAFEGLGATLHRILIAFLFLFVANLYVDKIRMRRHLDEVLEGMNMLLYGKNYRRDREAVRILIAGLASEKEDVRVTAWENLKRLTGQQFALDREVWQTWWRANEKVFAAKSKRPEE